MPNSPCKRLPGIAARNCVLLQLAMRLLLLYGFVFCTSSSLSFASRAQSGLCYYFGGVQTANETGEGKARELAERLLRAFEGSHAELPPEAKISTHLEANQFTVTVKLNGHREVLLLTSPLKYGPRLPAGMAPGAIKKFIDEIWESYSSNTLGKVIHAAKMSSTWSAKIVSEDQTSTITESLRYEHDTEGEIPIEGITVVFTVELPNLDPSHLDLTAFEPGQLPGPAPVK
jgi:hypothetical protein